VHLLAVFRIVGIFIGLFGSTLVFPVVVGLIYGEQATSSFLIPMLSYVAIGAGLFIIGRPLLDENHLGTRDGFLIVALFWVLLTLLGAWPMVLGFGMSPVDALFESASGLTTTGATVLTGLDDMPRSLLFYRQLLQWLGGMGLIVLGVAVLPMLGIGGMQLYRAETPGPVKGEKLTPRLGATARILWLIYLGLTILCALAYWFAGMSAFDAIAHSLSTLSTGGFSTHDASLAYFDSAAIEAIAVFFMLLAAINFGVHFAVLHHRRPWLYFRDIESRSFLAIVFAVTLLVSVVLLMQGDYAGWHDSLRDSVFEVVSVVTSTGFGIVDFTHWPDFLPLMLIMISFIGGCGGSTAGGMKVMRLLLLVQQGNREIRQLLHPHARLPLRLGGRLVDNSMVQGVWGYFAVYVTTFAILTLVMIHAGLDETSAFAAVATSMNNLGPGLGQVAYTFQDVSDLGKMVSVVAMLLGRLEIFTLLVLLSPDFWRR
jgi:trk system potassium uptake protein TrkH